MATTGRITADEIDRRRRGKQLGKARPKGTLPLLPRGRDLEQIRAWLTLAFRPGDEYQVDVFERAGRQRTDPCSLTFRSGRDTATYRWGSQSELRGSQLRGNVLGITDAWCDMPRLTESEQDDVWAGLVKLGKVVSEVDDRDEARKWVQQILDAASPLRGFTLVPDGRHDALMALRNHGEFTRPDAEQFKRPSEENSIRRPVRFVDDKTAEQFIRAGETATFVRHVVGETRLPYSTLRARLAEIGVPAVRFEHHLSPHPKAVLYQLSEDLVEYIEAASPSPATKPDSLFGGKNDRGERMEF
jgi:hypothetical protein